MRFAAFCTNLMRQGGVRQPACLFPVQGLVRNGPTWLPSTRGAQASHGLMGAVGTGAALLPSRFAAAWDRRK